MQLSLMGIQFEKLKKKFQPTHTGKTGWVRGNKNVFKAGLMHLKSKCYIHLNHIM